MSKETWYVRNVKLYLSTKDYKRLKPQLETLFAKPKKQNPKSEQLRSGDK